MLSVSGRVRSARHETPGWGSAEQLRQAVGYLDPTPC